ncbi:hypothetical protein JCM10212_002614 [Sporobolomyces blumeae]
MGKKRERSQARERSIAVDLPRRSFFTTSSPSRPEPAPDPAHRPSSRRRRRPLDDLSPVVQGSSDRPEKRSRTSRDERAAFELAPSTPDHTMDDLSLSSSASYANSWISWFLASKGNEYFCEIDEEYIVDRFNLTGLNAEVSGYSAALDLITDTAADEDLNDEQREQLETSARHLYGLIHARFIITSRGLSKMIDKYKKGDFGRCPRVLCYGQSLLPLGLSDIPYQKAVKLYCPRCEDLYSPKSSRHGSIDGAYFGSTFCHMLFMVYPGMIPSKSVPGNAQGSTSSSSGGGGGGGGNGPPLGGQHSAGGPGQANVVSSGGAAGGAASGALGSQAASKVERVRPRIFGFQVHEHARLLRWQEKVRDQQIARLEEHERQGRVERLD